MMIDKSLNKQWSIAFFTLVAETEKLDQYQAEALILIDTFKKFPAFLNIIASNWLPLVIKQKIINLVFVDCLPYMLNFLLLLTEKKHFYHVINILKAFRNMCNSYYGIEYGVVYSAVLLTETQVIRLQNKISKIMNIKKIELVNKIDETLIAGVKVKVKNKIFDGSVLRQIEQLKLIK